jgi:Xaa-Pro aminopeptidase
MEQLYQERLRRVQQVLQEHNLDYMFLSISPDLFYLTGYSSFLSERLHLLVIPPEGRPTMIFPDFEKEMIAHLTDAIDVAGWPESEGPYGVVREAVAPQQRLLPSRIAIGDHTYALFLLRIQEALPRAQFIPASQLLAPLRRVKDRVELQILKEAQDMAVQALQRLLEQPLAGRTEKQVATDLRHICEDVGFEKAWEALVGSGPNGAMPHLLPTERIIQRGEPVVIDFAAIHQGYYSDCTRTVHVGPPSGEFREVFETVRLANHKALAAVRPGVECESIDQAARRAIEEAGYGEFFTHRLGHGVGIEVHEEPYMVAGTNLFLEPGMTFTDEPGIYLPGKFGCRLEDVVTVTDAGGKALTEYTHELIIVD